MLRFKNQQKLPNQPDYTVRETGVTLKAGVFDDLCFMVTRHMSANGVQIPPNLPAIIEDDLCRRLGNGRCVDENGAPAGGTPTTARGVLRLTEEVLKEWILKGRPSVSLKCAEMRAVVCCDCDQNTKFSWCSGCDGSWDWARKQVDRRTRYDDFLKVCYLDASFTVAMIHLDIDVIDRQLVRDRTDYPSHCWKLAARMATQA